MALRFLCLPGDGIGPEIMEATRTVVAASARAHGMAIDLPEADIGFAALADHGTTLPRTVVEAARAADGVILGPVSHNDYPARTEGGLNPSGELRRALDLYANIRPARSVPGVPTPIGVPVDLVIARENLEGFYADRNMHEGGGEFSPVPGVALALRKITAKGSERIARAAFELAERRPAKRVTAVHKANVMRMTDGLFLDAVRAVAGDHPGVAYDEVLVDAAAALLVRDPSRFDVLVTTNMFGDILSDLASELAGGLGLAASLNIGPGHAVAQAQHGSAPDIADRGVANPTSLILSACMLLEHLGHPAPAASIRGAVHAALVDDSARTPDLGGRGTTRSFTDRILNALAETPK